MAAIAVAQNPSGISAARLALGALVMVAGVVHLVLAPEHLERSFVLGLGFLGFGAVQVGVGAFVLRSPSRTGAVAALLVSLASLVPLVAAVTVGLPFLPEGTSRGPLGPVEIIDDLAAMTGLAELLAVVVSGRLMGDRRPTPRSAEAGLPGRGSSRDHR